ncbi:MAG: hypothetical protein ACTTKL_07700, partial [Treponema sp.]
ISLQPLLTQLQQFAHANCRGRTTPFHHSHEVSNTVLREFSQRKTQGGLDKVSSVTHISLQPLLTQLQQFAHANCVGREALLYHSDIVSNSVLYEFAARKTQGGREKVSFITHISSPSYSSLLQKLQRADNSISSFTQSFKHSFARVFPKENSGRTGESFFYHAYFLTQI